MNIVDLVKDDKMFSLYIQAFGESAALSFTLCLSTWVVWLLTWHTVITPESMVHLSRRLWLWL
jgi:hypothetical protein